MALFHDGLLPASFRGVPFAVAANETGGGRRIALHQYPGRDTPWAEDMGRDVRRFRFRGFLVADDKVLFGGPIQLQRLLLLAALEKEGPGTLTHPTLGILNVSVQRFSLGEDLAAGTYSDVDIEFVESGKKSFPSLLTNSTGLFTAANLCKVALAIDFGRAIVAAVSAGGSHDDVAPAAADLSAQVQSLGTDATALTSLAAQLPGSLGRYSAGANTGYAGATLSPYTADTPIATLVAAAADKRVAISNAATALTTAIAGVTVTTTDVDVATAATALVDALGAVSADPADALRLLLALLAYAPTGPIAAGAVGIAVADAFRRSAIVALVEAAARYQPTSYDDASSVLALLADRLDDQIVIAGDEGADQTFDTLRTLRSALVADLRARGASLARVRTFTLGTTMPALALAQRLYEDVSRADELIRQANPVSPLFMPPSFQALAA